MQGAKQTRIVPRGKLELDRVRHQEKAWQVYSLPLASCRCALALACGRANDGVVGRREEHLCIYTPAAANFWVEAKPLTFFNRALHEGIFSFSALRVAGTRGVNVPTVPRSSRGWPRTFPTIHPLEAGARARRGTGERAPLADCAEGSEATLWFL